MMLPLIAVIGCSTVTVTKTSKGFSPPISPSNVDIFGTVPKFEFEEIGIVNANIYGSPETAYNNIRTKAGAIGADGVILNNQVPLGERLLITGTAIRKKK